MKDRHAIGDAGLDATASLPFQNHNNGYREEARSHGGGHLIHQCSSRSSSVPPPAGRTRPDDIRSIDEKHCSSLTVRRGWRQREGGQSNPGPAIWATPAPTICTGILGHP